VAATCAGASAALAQVDLASLALPEQRGESALDSSFGVTLWLLSSVRDWIKRRSDMGGKSGAMR